MARTDKLGGTVRVGMKVEVLDLHVCNNKWCRATVVDVRRGEGGVLEARIHYKVRAARRRGLHGPSSFSQP